ncbi:hypothetical protein ACJX0J_025305, partial [Zea mays]
RHVSYRVHLNLTPNEETTSTAVRKVHHTITRLCTLAEYHMQIIHLLISIVLPL